MNLRAWFFSPDVPTEGGGAATKPAGTPTLPRTSPDALKSAASQFTVDLAKKTTDQPADKDKKEDKPEGKPADPSTPAVDPKADGTDKEKKEGEEEKKEGEEEKPAAPVEDELTPEDKLIIQQALDQQAEADKALKVVDLWASNITPETAAWIESMRKKRMEQRAAAEVASKAASGQGLTEADKKEIAELATNFQPVQFNAKDHWRSIGKVEETKDFTPPYITAENLQKEFGIDPNKVPAKFAPVLTALIARHNRLVADASFLFKENKKAYQARDQAKDALIQNEFRSAVAEAGYEVDDSVMMLKDEFKKSIFVNGKRQPVPDVVQRLVATHSKMFTKKTAPATTAGKPQPAGASDAPTDTPTAPTTPPVGTRHNQSAPPPPPTTPKDIAGAKSAFQQDMKKLLDKARK